MTEKYYYLGLLNIYSPKKKPTTFYSIDNQDKISIYEDDFDCLFIVKKRENLDNINNIYDIVKIVYTYDDDEFNFTEENYIKMFSKKA